MKIGENKVVTLEYKVYDADTKELLEDTTELGPYFYIQGMGQFLPKIEAALDGKSKGHKLKNWDPYGWKLMGIMMKN